MRITADKVESGPPHAVTPAEVREMLSRLPSDWTSQVETVRISASMHSWEVACFSRVLRRLVLCTREREKAAVFSALSRELFSHATQTHPIPEWRLSQRQKTVLNAKIAARLAKPLKPNKAPEPTPTSVMPAAQAAVPPAAVVAHL